MVNNKSSNNCVSVEHSSPRVSQKNMDTLRVLSNIRLPNIASTSNQWNTNNGYMTEEYENQTKNMGARRNLIDEALTEALNTENQRNGIDDLTNISMPESFLNALSPWEIEIESQSETKWQPISTSNNKEKSKSRRQPAKEGQSKKQKIKEQPNQLKNLLLQCDSKKEKTKCVKRDEVIILSDSNPEQNIEIFSQDTDMAIFKQAIDLKRNLIINKEAVEHEYKVRESEIKKLRDELAAAENELLEIQKRKDNLTKKVEWALKSL